MFKLIELKGEWGQADYFLFWRLEICYDTYLSPHNVSYAVYHKNGLLQVTRYQYLNI